MDNCGQVLSIYSTFILSYIFTLTVVNLTACLITVSCTRSAVPSDMLHDNVYVFSHCQCPSLSEVCSCSTWSRNSLLKGVRVKEGEERKEDSGDGPTPNQCNHRPYQTAIQSEGSSDSEREAGKESFSRIHVCVHVYPPPSSHLLLCPFMGYDGLPSYCVSRFI